MKYNMKKKFKKILVTGADGFIGSHLCEYLTHQGYDIKAFTLYNSFGTNGWLDTTGLDCEIVRADVRDSFAVKKAMQGCDAVCHLAALIAIPYSYDAPHSYIETNINGTLNIVEAARDLGVERVVVTSTSEVYGTALYVPIDENHPLQGQSPYSATKIGADSLALSFHKSFGTPVSVLRPFNTFGPRQSLRAVIPSVICQGVRGKMRGEKTIMLNIGDTSPTRDFSYCIDTASGFLACLLSDKAIGETINLGSGFEISVGDTINLIGQQLGVEFQLSTDQQRLRPQNSEVFRLFADNKKALEYMQWQPQYAGLAGFARAIAPTIEWFSNPDNLRHYPKDSYVK